MECPTCKYPVPAEWLMCRRCGAPLQSGPEAGRVTIPSTMQRRLAAAGGRAGMANVAAPPRPPAPMAAAAAAARSGPADTLLPGALPRPDNLLPRPVRGAATSAAPASAPDDIGTSRAARERARAQARISPVARAVAFARVHWRRIVVSAVVAVTLTFSVTAVWPVLFKSNASNTPFPAAAAARESIATKLLRTVSDGGRALYAPGHTYPEVTPSVLSSFSSNVPIVDAKTLATPGHVSMQLNSARMLTLATPVDAERCVFARDEPAKGKTQFVTVRSTNCRAIAAPTKGWHKG